MKELQTIIKDIETNFSKIKEYEEFKIIKSEQSAWLSNLEDKVNTLDDKTVIDALNRIIVKLKNKNDFTNDDIIDLNIFTSKINSIVKIVDWLNNFNNSNVNVLELFNLMMKSASYSEFSHQKIDIQKRLQQFLPHLYSVVKHLQDPDDYPIYYKFWKNIISQVLGKSEDYDTMCEVYRELKSANKHIVFGAYLGTIATLVANKINKMNIINSSEDKKYKWIKSNLLNIEPYLSLVLNSDENSNKENNGANEVPNDNNQIQHPLNQILYGPPGTGKTYHTINKAIEIIENNFYQMHKESTTENRTALKNKFDELKESGQIVFTTFHQSFGYEEFVEGIKAKTKNNMIEYKVENGIFKTLSEVAKENYENSKKTNKQLVQEKTLKQKLEIFLNDALENGTEFTKTKGGKFSIIELSQDEITIYAEDSNYSDKKISIPIDEFFKIFKSDIEIKTSRQMAKDIFGIDNQRQRDTYYFAMWKKFQEMKFEHIEEIKIKESLKKYILIIDEINRGNISKIFGELITLIEPSKRLGADEAIKLKLPYSNEEFGIPQNLYIIGTMNTADRSIALMDTALRRRFDFVEMMPNLDMLNNLMINGINIKLLLETINKRVEHLYDRDHTIGHAYFMSLKDPKITDKKAELDSIFRNKIIPLLQEYFYDDWEKIQIVLGDHLKQSADPINKFVLEEKKNENSILLFHYNDIEEEQYNYKINAQFSNEAYQKLCLNK